MERNAENVSSEEKSGVNKNRSEKERLLRNYSLVLFKALVPAKGQKTLIKKLYSESNEVVAGCSVEQLCTAVQEPSFLASSEFFSNVSSSCRNCAVEEVDRALCEHYGEVLLRAWKKTISEDALRAAIEDSLTHIVYLALCCEVDVAGKFFAVLLPFRKARCKQIDPMLFRIVRPNLWRCLKARSGQVRFNACVFLTNFYPILSDDQVECCEYLLRQQESLLQLLFDDVYSIRAKTCKGAMSILASFWVAFDSGFVKQLLTSFWDVVNMDLILRCFDVESVESVRKQIATFLLRTFKLQEVDEDEAIRRIIFMGEMTHVAALNFHRLIVTQKLITVHQALKHVQMLAVVLYKMLRPLTGVNRSSDSDEHWHTWSAKGKPSSPIVVDAGKEDKSRGAGKWHACCLLLDCLVVMWTALRKQLQEDHSCQTEQARTLNILSQLFELLFTYLRESTMMESIMALGSALNEQKSASAVVLHELLSDNPLSEEKLLPYLETAASWQFPVILEFVSSGLRAIDVVFDELTEGREMIGDDTKRCFGRALQYLMLILKSPTMRQNLTTNHEAFLLRFHADLMRLNDVVAAQLGRDSAASFQQGISLCDSLQAYELRHTLSIILLNTMKTEESHLEIEQLVEDDAVWLIDTALKMLTTVIGTSKAHFLIRLSQNALRLLGYHLGSYSHSLRYKRTVIRVISTVAMSGNSSLLIIPALKTLRDIYEAMERPEDMEFLLDTLVPLTHRCLLWMTERVNDNDFDMRFRIFFFWFLHAADVCKCFQGCAEEFLNVLKVMRAMNKLSETIIGKYVKHIIITSITALMEMNKNDLYVLSPLDSDFKIPGVVELLLQRIALKDPVVHSKTLSVLQKMVQSEALISRYGSEDVFFVYGAVTQFALLSNKKKIDKANSELSLPMTAQASAACMEAIREQMEQHIGSVQWRGIYEKILELCHS
ncbi:Condensin-2 complex subunit G2 [Toxocara canis]|uniref:Condensin-2 complex subunit G2 n=1 Tax=Toxocara canis TaxID=6265 RepID=A0A0B2VB89_TOXCA|nr:Condensin-2 complex subunit G2 [Toxocara canis]